MLAAFLVVSAVFLGSQVAWMFHVRSLEASFAVEREMLLTRAMHPQVVFPPQMARSTEVEKVQPEDEFERVGSVDWQVSDA